MAQGSNGVGGRTAVNFGSANVPGGDLGGAGSTGVNRKKQKRRQKQAAREFAEREHPDLLQQYARSNNATVRNGHVPQSRTATHQSVLNQQPAQPQIDYSDPDFDGLEQFEPPEGEDLYSSDEDGQGYPETYGMVPDSNGQYAGTYTQNTEPGRNSRMKARKKSPRREFPYQMPPGGLPSLQMPASARMQPRPPPPPPISSAAARTLQRAGTGDHIWNTSTQEERERIKEFWLALSEEDRKSLVKIEKEAVLRKMKEQQKHSCSCTVCGRKRTAIEEELEVLYDAYYEELEQYANHQQGVDGAPVLPPPRDFGPSLATRTPSNRAPPLANSQKPARGRIREIPDDEEEEDEEEEGDEEDYSDDEDDYSDEEPEGMARGPAADFFQFGNSLTVKGGILTVADDLLKNDGKKFIEMMEQLAERRMQREEEAQFAASGLNHPSMQMPHPHPDLNHGPPPEDEEYDDAEDDEYDSQEDYDVDEDEMDTMTKEQRMEEGRRMFQIFAARMFEQRVLTAYREKVARERQQKLLEELEEESRLDEQREAKKARDAQKKKDKKQQQKQAKAEEKARKETEKAAEEAAAKAAEEKRQEEQRQKREEQRKRKEAEKKTQDAERQRKEAEKQKRLQEERERQQEAERKLREQKTQEKKLREDAKRREQEEKEAREREGKERRAQEEKKRRETEAQAQAERDAKERTRNEEQASQAAQLSKRSSLPAVVALPPGLQAKQALPGFPSPHTPVATPNIPNAPNLNHPRQGSRQGSLGSSPKTPQILPRPNLAASPQGIPPPNSNSASKPMSLRPPNYFPTALSPQPASPMHSVAPPPGMHHLQSPAAPLPSAIPPGFANSQGPLMHVMGRKPPHAQHLPTFPHGGPLMGQHRPFVPQANMPGLPLSVVGAGGHSGQIAYGRGYQAEAAPGLSQPPSATLPPNPVSTFHTSRDHGSVHSRHQSIERVSPVNPASTSNPIARPMPIQRPPSVKLEDNQPKVRLIESEIDELSNHLGSSALLHDSVETGPSRSTDGRRSSAAPGSSRPMFGPSPIYTDQTPQPRLEAFGSSRSAGSATSWNPSPMPFGSPSSSIAGGWSSVSGPGWPGMSGFGAANGHHRTNMPRPIYLRLMLCHACKQLNATRDTPDGYHDAAVILRQVEMNRGPNDPQMQMEDLLQLCETEGDVQNGGGQFATREDAHKRTLVRYEPDSSSGLPASRGPAGLGEIGSPVPGNSIAAFGGPRHFQSLGGLAMPGL